MWPPAWRMSWQTMAEATGGALKSAPRSKRCEASVCRPWRRAAAADGRGIEPGGFDQDVFGLGGDHRVPAAHDAGQAEGLLFIGDDEVFGIEHAFDAIQGPQLFACTGAADDDAAFDLVEVEGVGGLAHGEQ